MAKVRVLAEAGKGVSSLRQTTREERVLRKRLRDLSTAVSTHLAVLDALMKAPSTPERGRLVARLANRLNVANDAALHFGLGLSFEKIRKQYHHDSEVTFEQVTRWLEEAIGRRRKP